MENNKSGKTLDNFLSGKGFYIVLFICAAIVGVSAWSLLATESTNENTGETTLEGGGVVSGEYENFEDYAPIEPTISNDEPSIIEEPPETAQTSVFKQGTVWGETSNNYIVPVEGGVQRDYCIDKLEYDETMSDWRTHDGIDIEAEKGTAVVATLSGTIESVKTDDMYGITVVVNHGNDIKSIYSNLLDKPAVSAGDQVTSGQIIGYIGDSALCELSQKSHLHFAMTKDGKSVDPNKYLPA